MWNTYLPLMLDLRFLIIVILPRGSSWITNTVHVQFHFANSKATTTTFMFHCFKSLYTLSTSFSNMVYPLPVSRFMLQKFWWKGNWFLPLSWLKFLILSILAAYANRGAVWPFLINVLISGALELQIEHGRIHLKANISCYNFCE